MIRTPYGDIDDQVVDWSIAAPPRKPRRCSCQKPECPATPTTAAPSWTLRITRPDGVAIDPVSLVAKALHAPEVP